MKPVIPIFFLSLLIAGCGGDSGGLPVLSPGTYYTDQGGIFESSHRQLILRGANVENYAKYSADHLPRMTETDFLKMRDWGMDHVRLLVFWMAIEPEKGVTNTDYIDRIVEIVKWANDADIRIILDMHQDVFGEGFGDNGAPRWACDEKYYQSFVHVEPWWANYFSAEVSACFDNFWHSAELQDHYLTSVQHLIARFVDDPGVIGLDVMNEPFCGTSSMEDCDLLLSIFYRKIADAVHRLDPGKLIFFEHNYTENTITETYLPPPDYPNAVFAPHYYDNVMRTSGSYDLDPSPVRDYVAERQADARSFGTPFWFGEYGGESTVTNIIQFLDDNLDVFDESLAHAAIYEYGYDTNGVELLDSDKNEKPFLVSVVRPYPKAVAGKIASFSFDKDSKLFKLSFHSDKRIKDPTVIAVPELQYPNGIAVSGCESPSCRHELDPAKHELQVWCSTDGLVEITMDKTE